MLPSWLTSWRGKLHALQHDDGKLAELARLLAPDDPSLVDEIRLAVDGMDDYVDRFQDRLGWRGISRANCTECDLPWIALVDGLAARKRLEEIDWRSPGDEVAGAMRTIAADQDWNWLAAVEWADKKPHGMFSEIEKRLSAKGQTLVVVDIGSDSYPLMALPTGQVEESRRLAALAGYGEIKSALTA